MQAQHSVPRRAVLEPIRFGDFLVERCAIDDGQLLDALAEHWANGGRLGAAIARRGYLTAGEIEKLAAEYHGLGVVEVAAVDEIALAPCDS
ncbi:MAG: hypothetical protein HY698_10550 [Deltaproteobacteria bacterium]|nr:hypothetical protein [Deltaproteobacteria bacterium]